MVKDKKSILVATDFRKSSTLALDMAGRWGDKLNEDIVLLHVDNKALPLPDLQTMTSLSEFEFKNRFQHLQEKYSREFEEQIGATGARRENVEVISMSGKVEDCIHDYAENNLQKTDMIFLGEDRKWFKYFNFLSSSHEKLIQISPVPVVICKGDQKTIPQNILLACDFSYINEKALDWVIHLASAFEAKVYLAHFLRMSFDDYLSSSRTDPAYVGTATNTNLSSNAASVGELKDYIHRPIVKILEEKLISLRDKVRMEGVTCESSLHVEFNGPIENELGRLIKEWNIDLLVMGKNSSSKDKNSIGRLAFKFGRNSSHSLAVFNSAEEQVNL